MSTKSRDRGVSLAPSVSMVRRCVLQAVFLASRSSRGSEAEHAWTQA